MHGDISRSTFNASRHYSGVRMQQGRVQLDADWNEQLDIQAHRERAAIIDAIGGAAGPFRATGFALRPSAAGDDLLVAPGRYWVRGLLCDATTEDTAVTSVSGSRVRLTTTFLDGADIAAGDWVWLWGSDDREELCRVTSVSAAAGDLELDPAPSMDANWVRLARVWSFRRQPDLPGGSANQPIAADGYHLAYLDVWERPITSLEDPAIQEVALGGADTATRTKTVWQLWLLPLPGPSEELDIEPGEALDSLKPTGTVAARVHAPDGAADLCAPVPGGGFKGAENQLYRIQVRSVDDDQMVSGFVWSRDNASVTTGWIDSHDTELEVTGIGRDAILGFAGQQWVELLDDAHELRQVPGTLVRLTGAEANTLHVDPATATGPTSIAAFMQGHSKVRRWDSAGEIAPAPGTWIDIENGIQVQFSPGTYCEGDFWLIPARSATGDIDWPRSAGGTPLARLPDGVDHAYAPVALVRLQGGSPEVVEDLRSKFAALSDITSAHIPHRESERIPGARTIEEALEFLARRVIELEQHIASLHPERPPPRRRGWR